MSVIRDSNGDNVISSKVIEAATVINPGGAEKISYDPVNKHAWLITGEYNEAGGQVLVLDYSRGFNKKPRLIGEAFQGAMQRTLRSVAKVWQLRPSLIP